MASVHPIGGKELRALRRLQRETPEGARTVHIFVSERLAPLSVAGYQRMVARAGEAAGFPFLVHSHMLRHAPATSSPMTARTPARSSTISAIARSPRRCATRRWRRIGSRGSGRTRACTLARKSAAAGAVQEVARIVAQVRLRWPHVRILLRADSGFARDELMAWCEANGVHFLFGLAKNDRLIAEIAGGLRGGPRRRAGGPASRRATSRTSGGRRAAAGAASAGSSPRPSSPRMRPIRAPSSPR